MAGLGSGLRGVGTPPATARRWASDRTAPGPFGKTIIFPNGSTSMNPVLERLQSERGRQIEFVDNTLAGAEREQRDLVEAETNNLKAAKQRIAEIDAQIEPLVQFENLRDDAHTRTAALLGRRDGAPATAGPGPVYRSAGAFLIDYIRSRDPKADEGDRAASAERIAAARAIATQTTADTPGLLPEPIVGPLINLMDASRPFITSIGAKDMGNVPGKKFSRPRITQHVAVGKQTAEKTELPSQKMIIGSLEFNKETYGGTVNISRQDIDWTSPSAWDALVTDLADVYALQTEAAAATAFAASVTQTQAADTADLKGYAEALYAAAATAYAGVKRLPNRIWVSLDMWASVGAIVDVFGRMTFSGSGAGGDSSLSDFRGDMLNVPRIVVPEFPDGTMIVGNSTLVEFYEQRIGLLSAVEPAILGVEVAYGGYIATGTLEPTGFVKVTAPPVVPLARTTTAK